MRLKNNIYIYIYTRNRIVPEIYFIITIAKHAKELLKFLAPISFIRF